MGLVGLVESLAQCLKLEVFEALETNQTVRDSISELYGALARPIATLQSIHSRSLKTLDPSRSINLEYVLRPLKDDLGKLKKLLETLDHGPLKPSTRKRYVHRKIKSLLQKADLSHQAMTVALSEFQQQRQDQATFLSSNSAEDSLGILITIPVESSIVSTRNNELHRYRHQSIRSLHTDRGREDIICALGALQTPSDQEFIHQQKYNQRVPNTCEWFLRGEVFEEWLHGSEQVCWITGRPGSGKTVLALVPIYVLECIVLRCLRSAVIEECRRRLGSEQVSCYYVQREACSDALGIIRQILGQLCYTFYDKRQLKSVITSSLVKQLPK